MTKSHTSPVDVLRLFHYLTIPYCISPYLEQNGAHSYKFSPKLFTFNIIGSCFYFALDAFFISIYMSNLDYINITRLYLSIVYFALCRISSNMTYGNLIKFVNQINEIDTIFKDVSIFVDNKPNFILATILLAVFNIPTLIVSIYCFLVDNLVVSPINMAEFIYEILLSLGSMLIPIHFTAAAILLYGRYKLVNGQLEIYALLCKDSSPLLRRNLAQCSQAIFAIFGKLYDCAGCLNAAFQWQLEFTFNTIFYYAVSVFNYFITGEKIAGLRNNILNGTMAVSFLISMIMVCFVCNKIRNLSRKSSLLMLYLCDEDFEERDKKLMYSQSIYMMSQRVNFSASGLHNFDMQHITFVFTSIVTYLVVMNQMSSSTTSF